MAGQRRVKLPTALAVAVLRIAERARKPRGRQPISGRARVQESVVVSQARVRKAKLIAAGVPRGQATEQAATEAFTKLSKTHGLAMTTIKRRMQKR